jgi:beta-glucosidase
MENKNKILKFPKGFFWGAATSAHQVEGGNANDWTVWEKDNAQRLASEAGQKWEKWQQKKFPQMLNPENYISGRACDHYSRYEEDFDIAKSLNFNAFRISIEWSRIEPEEGKFNQKEIEHYRKVMKAIRARGMEPFVTLWHYTLPIWFAQKGGWTNEKSSEYFKRYARKMAKEFSDLVLFWITFNEPILLIGGEYIKGYRPPQKHNLIVAFCAFKNLIKAHKSAYVEIHKIKPRAMVGLSEWLNFFDDKNAFVKTRILYRIVRYFANERMIKKTLGHLDFIGAHYYVRVPFSFFSIFFRNKNYQKNDMSWDIAPEGFYSVLTDLKKFKLPIYITENGIPDCKDKKRSSFIKDHLVEVHRAISEGADVRGYLHWSFLDNFEWDKGFWPRFGLVEIDYKTMKRKIRPSAWEYKKICETNTLQL